MCFRSLAGIMVTEILSEVSFTEVSFMSEAVSSKPSKAGKRWLDIVWRILVAVLMLLAVLRFIISVAGISGVWYARPYSRTAVNGLPTVTTTTLVFCNNGIV